MEINLNDNFHKISLDSKLTNRKMKERGGGFKQSFLAVGTSQPSGVTLDLD